MPTNSYPLIAREGWPLIAMLVMLYLVLQFLHYDLVITTLLLATIFLVVFLHRDPERRIPAQPLAIVSPVYGVIASVTEVSDPYLERKAKCIRIEMRPWDIFSLRSPIEGKVMNQWSRSDTSDSLMQTSYAFWNQSDESDDVVTSIHLRKPKWRYRFYMQSGHRLGQGQRCGFIYFGSAVEVLVPADVKLQVDTGQCVRSGESTLAVIIHSRAASAYDGPNRGVQPTA